MNIFVPIVDAALIGGTVFAGAFVTRALHRISVSLSQIAMSSEGIGHSLGRLEAHADRGSNALFDLAIRAQTGARLAELELERRDRATPAIPPGPAPDLGPHPAEAFSSHPITSGPGTRFPWETARPLPVSEPIEGEPRDVACPACAGKFPADHMCKLCFGSNVTSAQAAAAYEAARDLPGSF